MESTETEVAEPTLRIRIVWVFQTSVRQIFKRGEDHWVHLDGSRESLFFGADPGWKPGDKVKVTMEKV